MGKDHTVVIESVLPKVELVMQGGIKETKPVLAFAGRKKKLVLNKTNATAIASLHGDDTGGWIGKPVTLYPTKTKCGRETVDCVRIRSTVNQAANGNDQPTTE